MKPRKDSRPGTSALAPRQHRYDTLIKNSVDHATGLSHRPLAGVLARQNPSSRWDRSRREHAAPTAASSSPKAHTRCAHPDRTTHARAINLGRVQTIKHTFNKIK